MSTSLPEVIFTLSRWLRYGGNRHEAKLTIECKDDSDFWSTYTALRSEISSLQGALCDPRKDILPVKIVEGQMQVAFEMMGYGITIKSAQVHAEPISAYFHGRFGDHFHGRFGDWPGKD